MTDNFYAACLVENERAKSIAALDAEFDCIMQECGGPVFDCSPDFQKQAEYLYRVACRAFPWEYIGPILRTLVVRKKSRAVEESVLMRNWPRIAWSLACYHNTRVSFEQGQHENIDLSPALWNQLLQRLLSNSEELLRDLDILAKAAQLPVHPSSPAERPVIQGWKQKLDLALLAAFEDFNPPQTADTILNASLAVGQFELALTEISNLMKTELQAFDAKMMHRRNSVDDPALHVLVAGLAPIWTSMTGRPASVGRVENSNSDEPAFVRFLQALIFHAGFEDLPSRRTVEKAINWVKSSDYPFKHHTAEAKK